MKRLSLALGLLVALGATHQQVAAKTSLQMPKLFKANPNKLHQHAYKGRLSMVKNIIAQGVDINVSYEWKEAVGPGLYTMRGSLLHAAVSGARTRVVKWLLENGAKIDKTVGMENLTELHVAAGGGRMARARNYSPIVKLLLAKGANVNAKTGDGNTPLHQAARGRRVGGRIDSKQIVKLLLAKRANPYLKNSQGLIPAEIAIKYNHEVLAKTLDPEDRLSKGRKKQMRKERRRATLKKIRV